MAQRPGTAPQTLREPDEKTILFASKLSLNEDKPVYLSYWKDSLTGKVVIYTDKKSNPPERVILKNKDEFTSPIVKKYTNKDDAIFCTENSIYILANNVKCM
jgi:hypothetical protein